MASLTFTWNKGSRELLSPNFRADEFECDCVRPDCVEQKIEKALIDRLEKLRASLGQPITVTSGFRCGPHQQALRGLGFQTANTTSQHELGRAADIRAPHLTTLFLLAEKEFKAIGTAKTFLHVDLRDDKTRRWRYS